MMGEMPMTSSIIHEKEEALLADLERARQSAIRKTFLRIDPVALGMGTGVLMVIAIVAATVRVLVSRTDPTLELGLGLIGHYVPGYDLNWSGLAKGTFFFFAGGFVLGWLAATFRNLSLRFVLWKMGYDAARWRRRHFLDEI
jgi:hypothetical protein